MSAGRFTLDELAGAPFEPVASFQELLGRWGWCENGRLWQVRDYARQEYWGERVLEVRSARGGWVKDIHEGKLWGVGKEQARWLMALDPEELEDLGRAIAERRALEAQTPVQPSVAKTRL